MSAGSDCDATVWRRACGASVSQDVRDATASQDACEESPLDSRVPGGEASSQIQLPQIMPINRALINPTDILVLSQSTYQRVHRRTPSVHLSMTSSASGKGVSGTMTPLSVDAFTFPSDVESLNPIRPSQHDIMPEPSTPELFARLQSMNPLYKQDIQLNKICEITADICNHRNEDNDVLKALAATFDSCLNDEYFPTKIVEVPPVPGARVPRYKFREEYAEHLISMMRLVSNVINAYLQAAQKPRSFTFGHSTFYNRQSFEELIYSNWTTKPIVLNLEHHLLQPLQSAHKAISTFMLSSDFVPSRGYPQVASPTFTSNTEFAAQVQEILAVNPSLSSLPTSPTREDELWQNNLDATVLQASYTQLSTSRAPRVRNELSESEEALSSINLRPTRANQSQALGTPFQKVSNDSNLSHKQYSIRSEPTSKPLPHITT
jgi:hypothetical protein